jgi:hypothetical protein
MEIANIVVFAPAWAGNEGSLIAHICDFYEV